jgi:hypothetical protein
MFTPKGIKLATSRSSSSRIIPRTQRAYPMENSSSSPRGFAFMISASFGSKALARRETSILRFQILLALLHSHRLAH